MEFEKSYFLPNPFDRNLKKGQQVKNFEKYKAVKFVRLAINATLNLSIETLGRKYGIRVVLFYP